MIKMVVVKSKQLLFLFLLCEKIREFNKAYYAEKENLK